MLGAHHLLADNFRSLSVAHNLFDPKPEPTVLLDCPLCSCKTDDGKRADCLIRRFHNAFESITSEGIAEWYSGLSGQAAIEVRAFFRVAAPSDPTIREALERILSQELSQREGLPVGVKVNGKKSRPRETLRDAFAFTAMVAVHEWCKIALVDGSNDDCADDCAALVACRFGIAAKTLRRRWNDAAPEVRESIKLHKPAPL